jgi:hypothetical protein
MNGTKAAAPTTLAPKARRRSSITLQQRRKDGQPHLGAEPHPHQPGRLAARA